MNQDVTTRLLLLGILLCLLALVVQGFAGASDAGRYTLTGMRAGAPVLIRTDTATGRAWKLELRGGGGVWQAFREPGEGGGEPEGPLLSELGRPEPDVPSTPAAPAPAAAPQEPTTLELPPLPGPPPVAPSPSSSGALDPQSLDSLLRAIAREDLPPEVRAWTAKQLGQSDDPRATEALLVALRSEDPQVRQSAAEALQGRADPRVQEALAERP